LYEAAEKLVAIYPILGVHFGIDSENGTLYQKFRADNSTLNRDIAVLEKGSTIQPIFNQLLHQAFDLAKEVFRLHIRTDSERGKTYLL